MTTGEIPDAGGNDTVQRVGVARFDSAKSTITVI